MVRIRDAKESDVDRIRDLFVRVYGENYPFPGFYDTEWLKRAVFDDETRFMIAELDGDVVATGSFMVDTGSLNDLVGELGRLVAESSKRARGAAAKLIAYLLEQVEDQVHFRYGEVRTVHRGSQRLADEFGWAPVGFEPMKYQFNHRESVVMYADLHPLARELRRNNPRIIPEISLLAQTALTNLGLPADVIVEEEETGYPTHEPCQIERLREQGYAPLLRIERGRVSGREVFGHFSLSHGFFQIKQSDSHYLVARHGDAIMGAVGFTHDKIDNKIRIFELIEFDDAVKGYLLASVDKIARNELNAAYQEVDISAYSPKMQRTLERLGFVPVAYCPSMVFDKVERLDIVRMAKVNETYDTGRMRLMPGGQRMQDIVELGLDDRLHGMEITNSTRGVELFNDLPDGDLFHLARISLLREYPAGVQLIREGDETDLIYILVTGEAEARRAGQTLATLGPGRIFGEMGLIQNAKRSADIYITQPSKVIEIEIHRLGRLMNTHPRLGYIVMRNMARSLCDKVNRRG